MIVKNEQDLSAELLHFAQCISVAMQLCFQPASYAI